MFIFATQSFVYHVFYTHFWLRPICLDEALFTLAHFDTMWFALFICKAFILCLLWKAVVDVDLETHATKTMKLWDLQFYRTSQLSAIVAMLQMRKTVAPGDLTIYSNSVRLWKLRQRSLYNARHTSPGRIEHKAVTKEYIEHGLNGAKCIKPGKKG